MWYSRGIMKIAVLLSGGVDSSVALRLLKDQGHDLTAFYLKIWLADELSYLGDCPWEQDLAFVRDVCTQEGVPLQVVNLQKEYQQKIVAYAIDQIKAGRTPNPDVMCNNMIKLGAFLDHIDDSFDKVATGHYAQVKEVNGVYQLIRSPDPVKDQTYFLSYLSQEQLARVLFPIGHLEKGHVRELAREFDLPTQARKDSQGLCFLGKIKFSDFVRHHIGDRPGELREFETDTVLGEHKGFWFYTIGQRRGSGLAGGPWYVVAKDPDRNIVWVSRTYYSADKLRDRFVVDNVRWIAAPPQTDHVQVKVRHGAAMHEAHIKQLENDCIEVNLADRDQGIAPGQFAAFYDGEICLGAGVIKAEPVSLHK